jgi:putative transposase
MRATDVIDVLVELFALRGVPQHIRSDNGPEFIAEAIRRWLEYAGVETLYIEPGSPWENGYAESFHSRFRDELLAREEFESVAEARTHGRRYRLEHNHRRPHSALGHEAPAEFAAGCAAASVRPTASLRQQHSRNSEHSPLPVTQSMLSSPLVQKTGAGQFPWESSFRSSCTRSRISGFSSSSRLIPLYFSRSSRTTLGRWSLLNSKVNTAALLRRILILLCDG